jgi:ribosomal protein S18 acetylase RimI-like enzyme
LELRFINLADPLYRAALELRFRVLREPLGHARSDVLFPFEDTSLHLVASEGTCALGCVLFHPEGDSGGRLYQMAIAPEAQRRGLGRALVEVLEAELSRRGLVHVHLHARAQAVAFYGRMGYAIHGEPFYEVGIEHRHMRRTLSSDLA